MESELPGELVALREELTDKLGRIEQQLDERLSLLCDEVRTANLLAYLRILRNGDPSTASASSAQIARIEREIQQRMGFPA